MAEIVDIAGGTRLANKMGVAQFFEVTPLTVGNWVRRGCPVVERGNQRNQWQFDLLTVARWKFETSTPAGEVDPNKLIPLDRKAWYELETKRRALQVMDGELVEASDVERTVGTVFAAISQDIQGMPDYLERSTGCGPVIVAEIEKYLDVGS